MKLYKEYGVNPFSGCWPVLLQFPILIAMYSVLRWPQHPIHVPTDSGLYAAVSQQIPETLPPGDPNGDADHDAGADQRPGPAGSDLGHLVPGDEPAVLGRARGQSGRHARREEPDRAEPRVPRQLRERGRGPDPLLRLRRADVRERPSTNSARCRRRPRRAARPSSRRSSRSCRSCSASSASSSPPASSCTGRPPTDGRSVSSTSCSRAGRRPSSWPRARSPSRRRPRRRDSCPR